MDNIIDHIKKVLMMPQQTSKGTYIPKMSSTGRIIRRCPMCKDSDDFRHGHLYLYITEEGVIVHDCKKCPESSSRTSYEFLNMTGVEDSLIEDYIRKTNKKGVNKRFNYDSAGITQFNYSVPTLVRDKDIEKAHYFEKRTGIKLNKKNIDKFKIVVNLEDFLEFNNINPYDGLSRSDIPKRKFIIKDFSKHFIGGLTYGGNKIMGRNIGGGTLGDPHYNFVINPKIKTNNFYIPKTTINIESKNPRIVMVEGLFDAICVKNHFYNIDDNDTIVLAAGSLGAYPTSLRKIIEMTGFIDANVFIYSDRGVSEETYRNKYFSLFKDNMRIMVYYNGDKKDFGHIKFLNDRQNIIKVKL